MVLEDNGWNLYTDLILVCKRVENKNNYYKAYVVNPKNKKQLETAREWARGYRDNEVIEFNFENSSDNSEEIISGIDKIVEKNREIFEEHNNILGLDSEYTNTSDSSTDEIISTEETVHDLNMGISTEKNQSNHNETIIVEINTEKVKENNLEVSKVKDVVLEVLENLRKADLDIFTELKSQSEERAEKVGLEREMKGLVSGLEGMLEIKFGVASLDIVPEIKKINEGIMNLKNRSVRFISMRSGMN